MSTGWGESRFVVVSQAELIQIPEYRKLVEESLEEDPTTYIEVDWDKAELLKEYGMTVEMNEDEQYTWIRTGISLDLIKEFLVEHLDAHPGKDVNVDFVSHRLRPLREIDVGEVVTCERYVTFHKDSKYVEKDLFNELNAMSKTSTLGEHS